MSELSKEVKRVADQVGGRILSEQYPVGLRLPSEAALATEMGCGRSTIREALRHLADMGLIQSRRGSGAMVLDFRRHGTPALLAPFLQHGQIENAGRLAMEMLRLRATMAAEAVRLAARYASTADLDQARAQLDLARLETDPAKHTQVELEFYRELVLASRVWPAAWLVNAFLEPVKKVNLMFAPMLNDIDPDFDRSMRALLELIENNDENAAVTLVTAWFDRVDANLHTLIGAQMSSPKTTDPSPLTTIGSTSP